MCNRLGSYNPVTNGPRAAGRGRAGRCPRGVTNSSKLHGSEYRCLHALSPCAQRVQPLLILLLLIPLFESPLAAQDVASPDAATQAPATSDSQPTATPATVTPATATPADATPVAAVDAAAIDAHIRDLADASYRVRQLARWRLEQSPLETLAAIEACLAQVDYESGDQLIDLLSAMATHSDVAISLRARAALQSHANGVSSLGRRASTALRAIADLQEAQALEILSHHGARFGSPNQLGFTLNAQLEQSSQLLALWIDQSFTGDEATIAWIQFLKSIDTVFLEGPDIGDQHFESLARLPAIKNVKLKHVRMTRENLQALSSLQTLEMLELSYVDIDDSYLELLAKLPVSQSLRLFGTRITHEGSERLAQQLDGIQIYCGKGGFLGIATNTKNTVVSGVTPGSGAELAGIQKGDILTHVDDVAIHDMDGLRMELGKHTAGDHIVISLKRPLALNETVEMHVDVTLGEE